MEKREEEKKELVTFAVHWKRRSAMVLIIRHFLNIYRELITASQPAMPDGGHTSQSRGAHTVCSGSVVVTAYDSESGCPGSNPEWGKYTLRSLHRAYPSLYPFGVVLHWVPEQLNIKAVPGACKLIDGCSFALCSATGSVVSSGICHINKVNSTA